MPRCFVALGGNLGNVPQTFRCALAQLDALPGMHVVRVSPVFGTAAIGAHAGSEFANAAAELDVALTPLQLLDCLQDAENAAGRIRTQRWGPRTLDLDLIFYGNEVLSLPRLQVPHPAAWYRRFVLDPLVEIAADVVHPERGRTVRELHAQLLERPYRVAVCGATAEARQQLLTAARGWFPPEVCTVTELPALVHAAAGEPAMILWLGPGPGGPDYAELPRQTRLDVSAHPAGPAAALSEVLSAALDTPTAALQPPAAEDAVDQPDAEQA